MEEKLQQQQVHVDDLEVEPPPVKRSKLEEDEVTKDDNLEKNGTNNKVALISSPDAKNGDQDSTTTKCVLEDKNIAERDEPPASPPTNNNKSPTELSKSTPPPPGKTPPKKKKKRKKLKPGSSSSGSTTPSPVKVKDSKKTAKSKAATALQKAEATAAAQKKAANLRKNIKDIFKTENLGEETLAAQREEAERRERMNLKLQQLKLLQAQTLAANAAALAAASASSSSSSSMNVPSPTTTLISPVNAPITPTSDFPPPPPANEADVAAVVSSGLPPPPLPPGVTLGGQDEHGVVIDASSYLSPPPSEHFISSSELPQEEIVCLSSDEERDDHDDDHEIKTCVTNNNNNNNIVHPYPTLSELRSHLTHPTEGFLPFSAKSSLSSFPLLPPGGGGDTSSSYFRKQQQLDDQNVISISSGDEEEDDSSSTNNCDNPVTTANSAPNGNGYHHNHHFSSSLSHHHLPYFQQQHHQQSDVILNESSSSGTGGRSGSARRGGRGGGGGGDNDSDDDCVVLSPTPESEDPIEKEERNLDELNILDSEGRVLVNVGHPDEDPDIFLAPQVSRIVKPHQIGGIRFLYDNVVESVERFNTASGFGCILAHSMGLGKTLQAVSFCDVFLRAARAKSILIIVPINTIQNWLNEFNVWLPTKKTVSKKKKKSVKKDQPTPPANTSDPTATTPTKNPPSPVDSTLTDSISETVSLNLSFDSTLNLFEKNEEDSAAPTEKQESDHDNDAGGPGDTVHLREFEVYVLNETVKTLQAREKIISEWSTKGGVMLIGYEMYRMLALKKLKKSGKKQPPNFPFSGGDEYSNEAVSLSNIYACLVDPGPDLVICDEGHRIKNSGASISQALKAIRTRRRVVLTGYPLQNNLMEYWCMVDFIRPNYLGSKVEFSNMFERPISNGQCVDSTPEDRRLMRFRSHVLHSLLEGFVQRRSHAVLHSALPQKKEWVFLLKMTTVQYNLYKEFMQYLSDNNTDGQCGANPIKAFAVCCKIWNHPDALYNVVRRKQSILDDLDLDELNSATGGGGSNWSNKSRRRGGPSRKKKEKEGSPQISFFDGSGFDFRRSTLDYSPMSSTSTRSGSEALSLDWALPIFENYVPGILENGVKFEILFEIIQETVHVKDKLLVFSQTLLSLDLVEYFLQQKFNWGKNAQYYRLDGSTTGLEREKLINNFNKLEGVFVFLVSTRAGSLGINLTGANRVVVLDASWNPCHDCQAVCRIYRYGQTKPCQIYRFVSDCTLEKRIYDRQINKRGMSDRVVDEMNFKPQFKSKDVSSFLVLKHDHLDKLQYIKCDLNPENYSDPILQNVLARHGDKLTQEPFEHESLLIDQKSQRLSATEKRLAHRNYLTEKRTAELQSASGYSYSRPSYAAYYPRESSTTTSSLLASNTSPSSSHRTSSSYLTSSASLSSTFRSSSHPVVQEDKFEHHVPALRAKGICVQSILLKKDSFLADPSGGPDMYLMGGEKIYVLRSEKGTYLRISNGKLIAVRNNASNSRFPILTVPPTQELSKEQLQTLVYSFLKLPNHHSYANDYIHGGAFSSSSTSTEQPLPPSASFYTHNKHHLQVTNTRSNSGGDVTMWPSSLNPQSPQSPLVGLPTTKSSSSSSSLNALLDSATINGAGGGLNFTSNLEKLSYLARFSSISTQHKNEHESSRRNRTLLSDDNSNSNSSFPPGFLFPPCPTQIFSRTGTTPPSTFASSSDVEVIPISKKRNRGGGGASPSVSSSASSNSQSATTFPYSHAVSISTSRPATNIETPTKSNPNEANPNFYEDFTITVKSPNKLSSSSASASNFTSRPGPHFNFDRGEYIAHHENVVANVSSSSPSAFHHHHQTSDNNGLGPDFSSALNQYYNNNGLLHNTKSNGSNSSSSSSRNEFPSFHQNQGV